MLSVCPVYNYNAGVLWPNGWMDQVDTVQKLLNKSRCRLGCGFGWPKES